MTEGNISTALTIFNPQNDQALMTLHNQAQGLLRYAETLEIKEAKDLIPTTNDLTLISRLKKALEEKRREYVSPLQSHVKVINDTFKTLMEPIEQADQITRGKIMAFQLKQKLIREEQEKINALRKEAADLDAALHNGEISESVNLIEVIPEVPRRVSTDMGSVGQRDNWQWEVIDINQVPREYLMINAGMLTPIVKASKGKIVIPGIRVFNKQILAVNTR